VNAALPRQEQTVCPNEYTSFVLVRLLNATLTSMTHLLAPLE
jgi:hypothetical protein